MLIDTNTVKKYLDSHRVQVKGVLHIGAHDCEELGCYKKWGLSEESVIWIEAMPHKVEQMKRLGRKNVYQAVISDEDDKSVTFHESNNGQSSSILDMKEHLNEHKGIFYIKHYELKTTTIDRFLEQHHIDPQNLTFWNIDIQGAELLALKGGHKAIEFAKAIYLEVNTKELYEKCAQLNEIDNFFSKKGFSRVAMKMTQYGWGDALYIRK